MNALCASSNYFIISIEKQFNRGNGYYCNVNSNIHRAVRLKRQLWIDYYRLLYR